MDYDVRVKSSGQYWQAWWRDAEGRIRTRGLGAKAKVSPRQARALCREIADELRQGPKGGAAPRLSDWLAKYYELRSDLAAPTLQIHRQCGRYLERYFDWDPPIDRITREDASEWRLALERGELLVDNARHTEKPADATVCLYVRTARRIFKAAADIDRITTNPFDRLRGTPAKGLKNWSEITPEELNRILDACPSPGWRAAFALMRLAGLRRGEALRLRWCDIDWNANLIRVNADIPVQSTKKRRRFPPIEPARCPSGLTKILRECFELAPEGAVRVCEGVDRGNVNHHGLAIVTRANIPPYKKLYHTLRKNLQTEWSMEYPLHVVTEWLGNSADVAQEHYLRVPAELYATPESVAESKPNTPESGRSTRGSAAEGDPDTTRKKQP